MKLEQKKMDDPEIIFVLENDLIIKGMDERYVHAYTELAEFKKEYNSILEIDKQRFIEDLIQGWKNLIFTIDKTMLDMNDWRDEIMNVRMYKLKLAFAKGFSFANSINL